MMGLGSLGSLNVLLSADTAQFTSQMDKAAYTAEKSLKKIGVAAKLSVAALTAAFIANTREALVFADTIGKMADKLGLTSEQMSKLAYVAKMSDLSVQELESSMRKMYMNAYNSVDAFAALGVSVRDSSGKLRNGYDILIDLADSFKRMPDGVGKATAAMEIFGKSGSDIVPMLNQGREGIKALAEEAKSLGVIVSAESAKNAERFDDLMKRMTEGLKGASIGFIDSIGRLVSGIKLINMSSEDYQKSIEEYRKSVDAQTESNKRSADSVAMQALAYEQAAEAEAKRKKMTEDGLKLTESMRTAQEKYNDELEFYNTLLQGNAISQETYSRAVDKAKESLNNSNKMTIKQVKDVKELDSVSRDLGFTFASAFEDAIIEGKRFSEILVSLGKDIERILLRKAVIEPLANALGAGITSFFSPGTSLSSQTAAFGGGTAPYTPPSNIGSMTLKSKHGNVFSNGSLVPFANGGVINSPMTFPMAGGKTGLAGEAGKEAILPLTRTASGDLGVKSSGGGTIVNVYAPAGSNVSQERSMDGNMETINIMIDEAVAGHVSRPGSKTHRSLKNTFGVGQTLTKR